MGTLYTTEQIQTGDWVRNLSATSYRGWKAFYHSVRWTRKRREILARDHYACVLCRQQGKYKRADTVHHVKHLKDAPELALTNENLISLCAACHDKQHPERGFGAQAAAKGYRNEERW